MYDTAFGGGMQFRGYAAAIGWVGAFFMLIVVAVMFYLFRSARLSGGARVRMARGKGAGDVLGRVDVIRSPWRRSDWRDGPGSDRCLASETADQVGNASAATRS